MHIQLRPYQSEAIENIRQAIRNGHQSICFVLPTGGGKTIVTGYMVDRAINENKLRCWFLVHRKELIDQTADKFKLFDFDYSYIATGRSYDPTKPAILAMVQTLARRLDKIDPEHYPDVIFIDETHHVKAKTYLDILETIKKKAKKKITIIGLTATPKRLDGKGLGDVFSVLVKGPSVKDLMIAGALCKYKIIAPPCNINFEDIKQKFGEFDAKQMAKKIEDAKMFGDVVEQYQKHLAGKKAIVFAQNVEHSKEICDLFLAQGIQAAHLDGNTSKPERLEIIEKFKNGEIDVLSNCFLISEGFDVPACEGVIMVRATASESMFLQMVGRAFRPDPDKPWAKIIDHVKNWERHGFPCMDREWLLDYPKKKRKVMDEFVKRCPCCYAVVAANLSKCPECGYLFPPPEVAAPIDMEFVVIDPEGAQLVFKTKEEKKRYINNELRKCKTEGEAKQVAIRAGYKPYWGKIQFDIRQGKFRNGNTGSHNKGFQQRRG